MTGPIASIFLTIFLSREDARGQDSLDEKTLSRCLESDEARDPGLLEERGILPKELAVEERDPAAGGAGGFSLGPIAGYLRARGSDHGAWFGGVDARLYLTSFLAAEGSVSVHQDRFENSDVRVTQWPVQETGRLFPFELPVVEPYTLGGGGWSYPWIHTRGLLASFEDETTSTFGIHVGAGVEIRPEAPFSLSVDASYILIEQTTDAETKSEPSFWQGTLGVVLGL